jgi:hypothetical protein
VIRTLAATTIWLLAGAGAAGAVFWAFLSTPESNIFTLALSAILMLVLFVVAAVTVNGAVLAWHQRGWSMGIIGGAVRGINAFVIPVLLVAIVWALAVLAVAWVERRQGEISAVFIARAGWSDVTWLFTAVEWAAWWITWVAAPLLALVWLRRALTGAWRPGWQLLQHALSPLRLAVATAAFVALIYLPWVYLVSWRPQFIPADTMELLFVGVKLGLFALLAGAGVALIIRAAATVKPTPGSVEEPEATVDTPSAVPLQGSEALAGQPALAGPVAPPLAFEAPQPPDLDLPLSSPLSTEAPEAPEALVAPVAPPAPLSVPPDDPGATGVKPMAPWAPAPPTSDQSEDAQPNSKKSESPAS